MPKPATAQIPLKQPPAYDGPPVKRVRAIQRGSNDYVIIEETFTGPPASVVVLKDGCPRISAEDRVRLWLENDMGLNRFGSSGL